MNMCAGARRQRTTDGRGLLNRGGSNLLFVITLEITCVPLAPAVPQALPLERGVVYSNQSFQSSRNVINT